MLKISHAFQIGHSRILVGAFDEAQDHAGLVCVRAYCTYSFLFNRTIYRKEVRSWRGKLELCLPGLIIPQQSKINSSVFQN